jgi:hypothetical protein
MEEWRIAATGGGCIFAGVGGPVSGNPARVMLFDDFFKNREEAESQVTRDARFGWMTSVAIPRLPEHGSALVTSTRWHPDDPSGRIRNGELGNGWEFISLPFLATRNERGERVANDFGDDVVWPQETLPDGTVAGWTVEGARQRLIDVGPYDAASIYQGQPRARGGTVYQQPARCEAPQINGARFVIGGDCAGTDGPNSNHTVLVALAVRDAFDADTRERSVAADVAGVLRLRLRPEHAAPQVLAWQRAFGGTPLHLEATRDGKDLGRALQAIAPGIVHRLRHRDWRQVRPRAAPRRSVERRAHPRPLRRAHDAADHRRRPRVVRPRGDQLLGDGRRGRRRRRARACVGRRQRPRSPLRRLPPPRADRPR